MLCRVHIIGCIVKISYILKLREETARYCEDVTSRAWRRITVVLAAMFCARVSVYTVYITTFFHLAMYINIRMVTLKVFVETVSA